MPVLPFVGNIALFFYAIKQGQKRKMETQCRENPQRFSGADKKDEKKKRKNGSINLRPQKLFLLDSVVISSVRNPRFLSQPFINNKSKKKNNKNSNCRGQYNSSFV